MSRLSELGSKLRKVRQDIQTARSESARKNEEAREAAVKRQILLAERLDREADAAERLAKAHERKAAAKRRLAEARGPGLFGRLFGSSKPKAKSIRHAAKHNATRRKPTKRKTAKRSTRRNITIRF